MKILAILFNVICWGFVSTVLTTDGPPQGADILVALLPLGMPVLNVLVLRLLRSPGRALHLATMGGNILWLAVACWLIIDRYPSHPEEEGLLVYVLFLAVTPLLSMVALYPGARASATPRTA